jgi:hypothetical protein
MPIPTEPVGSLPRPAKLQAAYADYDAARQRRTDMLMLDRRTLLRSGSAAVAVSARSPHSISDGNGWRTSWKS